MLRKLYYFRNYVFYKIRFFGRKIDVHYSAFVSSKCVLKTNGGGKIKIGRNCELHHSSMLLTYGGQIVLGDNSSVNPFTIIYGHGNSIIGSGVRIATHCTIIPANHILGNDDVPLYKQGVTTKGISIDDFSWIGTGCRILDGVTIGKHAVVGAGSVVNKSIPDYTIGVGVPVKLIKKYNDLANQKK